jgi:hypothetical protein
MKEYQFQYTKMRDTLLVLLSCVAIFILVIFIGVHLSVQQGVLTLIEIPIVFITFRLTKKFAVSNCTAKLSETSIEFDFADETKVINFSDLISFKNYSGKNGPILYLKTQTDNFKIFANNNFCKTDDFEIFSNDTIIHLDKYKDKNNLALTHEGSIYATKGFLYFLLIATLIYVLSFLIESAEVRLYVGIGGGFYLLIMWIAYFNKRDLKSK